MTTHLLPELRIKSGGYGRSNIETIFEWKTNGREDRAC